jgi:hypothetical protein
MLYLSISYAYLSIYLSSISYALSIYLSIYLSAGSHNPFPGLTSNAPKDHSPLTNSQHFPILPPGDHGDPFIHGPLGITNPSHGSFSVKSHLLPPLAEVSMADLRKAGSINIL